MLLSFRASNHRSLRDVQTLDLRSVYDKNKAALGVAAIYGANASGKSSVIEAFRFMHDAVTEQFIWKPGRAIPRDPFLLDQNSRNDSSSFAVELLLGGIRYVYGFTIDDKQVIEEWCYSYPKRQKRILVERSGQSFKFGTTTQSQRNELLTEITPSNTLFLSSAARTQASPFVEVSSWFSESLWFMRPSDNRGHDLARRFLESETEAATLISLLKAADLGISSVRVDDETHHIRSLKVHPEILNELTTRTPEVTAAPDEPPPEDKSSIKPSQFDVFRIALDETKPLLFAHHGKASAELAFSDESHGTRVWFNLLGLGISALQSGWILVIDEIDAGLHPLLLEQFVQLFRSSETNPLGAQLVFTAHDVSLLGRRAGEEILQRDEVWFVEKSAGTGASTLYSLTDFSPRDGLNWEKRYLGGALGAVPFLDKANIAEIITNFISNTEPKIDVDE